LRSKIGKALKDFGAAIKLSSTDWAIPVARAGVYIEKHQYAAALADGNAAIAAYPREDTAYSWRAKAHRATGHAALAAADEEKAMELKGIGCGPRIPRQAGQFDKS